MIYELRVNDDEMKVIAAGLGKLPYEVAQPMIDGLKRIVEAQAAIRAEQGTTNPAKPRRGRRKGEAAATTATA